MDVKTAEVRARIVARKLATVKRQVLAGDYSKTRQFLADCRKLKGA